MNGGMSYPPGYDDYDSGLERRFVRLSRAVASIANWIIPGKRRAAALLVANPRTRAALPIRDHPNIIDMAENGVDMTVWDAGCLEGAPPESPRPPNTIRLAFMGRLVKLKALDITLQAIAMGCGLGTSIEIDILGDGEEEERLRCLCNELGLASRARFHGFKPQRECSRILRQSDALILNSVHECGGAVVLEAMSVGLPVIASDWGGPADYLDANCGILVSPIPRSTFAQRLADAIVLLAQNPLLRASMGQAGAQKVRKEFDWNKKIDDVIGIYQSAMGFSRDEA
jgi:glycosyltransferase involved in cell wall biosynthesis